MRYDRAFRLIRAAKDMTQREMADALDVHESYVSMIESGNWEPGRRLVERVPGALGVRVYLLDLLATEELSYFARQEVGQMLVDLCVAEEGKSDE